MNDTSYFTNFGQVGIIVKDIEKARKNLEDIGIGPFGGLDAEPTVRWEAWNEPTEVKLKMLFAKIGPLEVELIEPISDCMQKEYLDTHGEGIQHYSFFVDDIDEVVEYMAEKGYKVVQRGWRATKGGYAFFDTEEKCGFMLEVIQR
ncbi:MAG: VOC family protein [Dehalococcoidales bacterium]|nr:VOC family protein [Dehalococcoidales bacterium]